MPMRKHIGFIELIVILSVIVLIVRGMAYKNSLKHVLTPNNNYCNPERIRLSCIMVKTKKETDEIIKELKSGRDFTEIAREKSKCPSSIHGGDLGYYEKGKFVPESYEAFFDINVKVGEIKIIKPKKEDRYSYWFIVKKTE
jgi:hypothetical protein